ncbi:YchJ family protein [Streptomyces sp. NPDC049879]|uniref:YchJ family protein n=1 Tax=Streptomyces sp. NPDC049879 TaxID=3365598 RepID=UPI0037B35166
MARRTPRRPQPPTPCPCGGPEAYASCCGRLHRGDATAPTAEALMRSRYSAFAHRDTAYLLRTWHPHTRPATLDLDATTRWTALEILATTEGTAFHTTGTVTFRAHYRTTTGPGTLHENSTFTRHKGEWVYENGITLP